MGSSHIQGRTGEDSQGPVLEALEIGDAEKREREKKGKSPFKRTVHSGLQDFVAE